MQDFHFSDVLETLGWNQMVPMWLLHLWKSKNHIYLKNVGVICGRWGYHTLLFPVSFINLDCVPLYLFLSFYIIDSMSLQPIFFKAVLSLETGIALLNILPFYFLSPVYLSFILFGRKFHVLSLNTESLHNAWHAFDCNK